MPEKNSGWMLDDSSLEEKLYGVDSVEKEVDSVEKEDKKDTKNT